MKKISFKTLLNQIKANSVLISYDFKIKLKTVDFNVL